MLHDLPWRGATGHQSSVDWSSLSPLSYINVLYCWSSLFRCIYLRTVSSWFLKIPVNIPNNLHLQLRTSKRLVFFLEMLQSPMWLCVTIVSNALTPPPESGAVSLWTSEFMRESSLKMVYIPASQLIGHCFFPTTIDQSVAILGSPFDPLRKLIPARIGMRLLWSWQHDPRSPCRPVTSWWAKELICRRAQWIPNGGDPKLSSKHNNFDGKTGKLMVTWGLGVSQFREITMLAPNPTFAHLQINNAPG